MNTESDSKPPAEEGVICPKCLLSNSPAAAFCADCGAPLGRMATIDPIQHIYAEGFSYRAAVDGPPSRIILLGMWLLFGPTAILGPCMLFAGRGPFETIAASLWSACSIVLLYRTTKNYLVIRWMKRGS